MDSEKRNKLICLVGDIAEALQGQWEMTPFPEDWGRLGAWLNETKTKAILSIGESQSARTHDTQLDVSTDYPRDRQGNSAYEPRPKISVSSSKSGSQIARDIERRLLPEYLPILEKVLKRYAASDEYEDKTSQIARQIASLVQVKLDPKSDAISFYHSPYKIFARTMSQAQPVDDDEVEITLRLDVNTSLKVLNQLIHGRFETPDLTNLDVDDSWRRR